MPTTLTWNDTVDAWLSETQSLNNAQLVADHFAGTDWSKEAISALCGNMRHESSINPNIWEYGYGHSLDRGYGLVQWTPASKYVDWATAQGLTYTEGDSQLARIDYEVDHNIQWIPISDYDYMTFADFRANIGNWSVDYLTAAFTWSYERPATSAGEESLPARQAFANECFSLLDWTGIGGGGTTPTPSKKLAMAAQYQYEKTGALGDMTYIQVKAGDNLSKIAKAHGVDMDGIKRVTFSDIKNKEAINVGEVLLIPTAKKVVKPVSKPKTYTVKPGDSLSKIAARLDVNQKDLILKNNIQNPNMIKVGQLLKY